MLPLLIAAALSAANVSAGAQVVSRRVGAVGVGQDSIVVAASSYGVLTIVASSAGLTAPTIATPASARAWARSADSVAHLPVDGNGEDELRFSAIRLAGVRGRLSYLRNPAGHQGAEHEVSSPDARGQSPVSVRLSGVQFDQLLADVTHAAEITDLLTNEARQDGGVLPKSELHPDGGAYFEFQVDQPARPDPQDPPPHYPDMLRSAKVEGEVLAQFVVDTTGRVELSTFKVLKSTHVLFTSSVKAALPTMRFSPAETGGVKVRQLVQMPFPFTLR